MHFQVRKYMSNILHDKEDIPGFYICGANCHLDDTRSLKVEAAKACCTFPDRRNLERETRCKTAMLVFIFWVKLSYPPHPAVLYITCHILLVWLSVAGAVMMWWGRKKKKKSTELWHLSRRTVWNLIEIVPCRWRPYIFLSHQPVLWKTSWQ